MDMNPFKPVIQHLDEFYGKIISIKYPINKFYLKFRLTKSHYIIFLRLGFSKKSMNVKEFNNHELDSLVINWMQYHSITLISLLIFLLA